MVSGEDVLAQLRPEDQAWLTRLAALAGPRVRAALVGGAVRDALLGVTPLDLDIVVEGADVEELARATGSPFLFHPAFQNATLTLTDGRFVDLVRARSETYPLPGQNPVPAPGTLEDDLRRRDFTVNALALLLGPEPELLDVTGGLSDLQRRLLRPIQPDSFHQDASRLIRGARIAARLDMHAAPELLAQVPDALRLAENTPRLWAELKLVFQEPRPWLALFKLHEWGVGGELLPDLHVMQALHELQEAGESVVPNTYAAAFLAGSHEPQDLSEKLGLGDKPLNLLSRAQFDTFYPPDTSEMQLRRILKPDSYISLTGKDVLALGIPPGKGVGEALAHLAQLRRAGQLQSQDEERAALLAFVKER